MLFYVVVMLLFLDRNMEQAATLIEAPQARSRIAMEIQALKSRLN